MAVSIQFGPTRVDVTDGVWTSSDHELAKICQSLADPDLVPASAPDQDEALAAQVAALLGGEIVGGNPPDESTSDPDVELIRRVNMESTQQQSGPEPEDILGPFWGGGRLPWHDAAHHFCLVGAPGSGKTLTLRLLMQSVLPGVGGCRALVYDAKNEMVPLLVGMGVPLDRIKIFNPFDARSVAWDIAADITRPATASEISSILIPQNKNAAQSFFTAAACDLLRGTFIALMKTAGDKWELRDVLLASRTRESLSTLLESVPETQDLASAYLGDEGENNETSQNILSTLAMNMAPLEPIAALWNHADEKVSLRHWMQNEYILVLGSEEKHGVGLDAINRVAFNYIAKLLIRDKSVTSKQTWILVDGARKLDGLDDLITKGRFKGACIVLTFQDIGSLREAYGQRTADEIISLCASTAILRLDSPETAEWASHILSPFKALLPGEFMRLPVTSPSLGLTGFYFSPSFGLWKKTLAGEFLRQNLKPRDPSVPAFIARPKEQEDLQAD